MGEAATRTVRLETFDADDVRPLSDALRSVGADADSAARVAQALVERLYASLADADGNPACALVRLYKTQLYGALDPEQQAFATEVLGEVPGPEVRCLTLLGTAGDRPEWNDPALSRGHRAIPLPSELVVERLPMVAQLIRQLGLDVGAVVAPPTGAAIIPLAQQTNDVFHVAEAVGSPYLPAQDDFVVPAGIRSAVGFGGIMLSGDFFAVLLFAKVPVSLQVARTLKILGLSVRTRLLPFAHTGR